MSLDISKLQKVVRLGDGGYSARCPACFEAGQDKKGNHLRIWPDGRFGCCLMPGDHTHRSRVFAIAKAGLSSLMAYTPLPPAPKPAIDAEGMWEAWERATERSWLEAFAAKLGVTVASLIAIGCVWASEHRAWGFPMKDGDGEIVGIRLRAECGSKWAVKGSRQGIFIPFLPSLDTVYICEGPTDVAAILSLGLYAIGRPSCSGCVTQTITALTRKRIRRAILFSDNDGPGLQGSKFLMNELPIPSCIFVPPCKDAREMVRLGATADLIACLISNLIWNQPKKANL